MFGPLFGPGGVLFLLAHEFRVSGRTWLAATRARGLVGRIVLYLILAVALGFFTFWVALGLSSIEPKPDPLPLGIIGAAFAVLFTLMLSQALMLITEALYQRGDLDLLLSSPLPPWRILIVRMAAIALNVATYYLILVGAVIVWLPFFDGWGWMAIMPAVLALSLLATAAGLLVARLLFLLIGPRGTRVLAQILAGLIGAAFFLAVQSQNLMPGPQRAAAYREISIKLAHFFGDQHSIASLPGRAALGDPLALVLWAGLCIGAYAVAVWWFAGRFAGNAAAIAGSGIRRRADDRTREIRGGLTQTLVRKEWRLLWRDPLLLSQIMLQLIYMLPLFWVFWRGVGDDDGLGAGRIGLFSGAFVLLSSALASSLTWLTVSAEDAPDLILGAPVARDVVERAKAIAAATPVLALMLIPIIAAFVIDLAAGFWLTLGVAASVVSSCLIGVWFQRPGSRKNFRRRTRGSFLVTIGQLFILLCWVLATGIAVAGWPIVSIIPAIIAVGVLLAMHESRAQPVLP